MANTKNTNDNDDENLSSSRLVQLEPNIDADKLSYEIFSILESKFLFGYDDDNYDTEKKLYFPKNDDDVVTRQLIGGDHHHHHHLKLPSQQRGKICVLSVDGGSGLQNVIAGKTLSYLEAALKKKSGNPDARIADYFDLAAGTGVGGVFSAMLFAPDDRGRPIFHADDTWRFLSSEVFSFCPPRQRKQRRGLLNRFLGKNRAGRSVPGSEKERALRKIFKDEMTLKDTIKPVLIPCYDLSSTAPFLFSRADALESDSYDFKLWEVCMATSAEPGSFGPVCLHSLDGSNRVVGIDGVLAMSNPTASAITHVLHNKQEFPFVRGVEDILVISVGAGGVVESRFDYEEVKKWQARDWTRPVARIVGEGSAELVDHAVAMAYGQVRSGNYVRIQANSSSVANIDESDPISSSSNIKRLIGIADEMLKQKNVESVLFSGKRIGEQSNAEKIEWFAEQLVLEHQRRSSRIAPTVAFKQAAAAAVSRNS